MHFRLLARIVAAGLAFPQEVLLAFEARVSDPEFSVTVPVPPDIQLQPQPTGPGSPPRWFGDDGTYKVTVTLTGMPQHVSARQCASVGLQAVLSQPGIA